ncbi:MAG TPA: hypothetical protein VFV52_07290 [Bacilli bacterium]|nr:hypothetical protein [Bacilli bacterium]
MTTCTIMFTLAGISATLAVAWLFATGIVSVNFGAIRAHVSRLIAGAFVIVFTALLGEVILSLSS